MKRASWFTIAYALMLGAAGPLAACAANGAQARHTSSALEQSQVNQSQTATPQTPQSTQEASPYSDAQLQAYIAARNEIRQMTPGQTAEQMAENQRRIGEILQRRNLAPDVYNAIEATARTDATLAHRIAALSVGELSDEQLRAFLSASAEIDPLNRSLATATETERTQIAEQIRAALQRHNLDIETYNGIAARARSDEALAARLTQLRAPAASDSQ